MFHVTWNIQKSFTSFPKAENTGFKVMLVNYAGQINVQVYRNIRPQGM